MIAAKTTRQQVQYRQLTIERHADDDLRDRVFRIKVTALMRLTRAVVPLMLDAGTNINGAILASDGGWSAL